MLLLNDPYLMAECGDDSSYPHALAFLDMIKEEKFQQVCHIMSHGIVAFNIDCR